MIFGKVILVCTCFYFNFTYPTTNLLEKQRNTTEECFTVWITENKTTSLHQMKLNIVKKVLLDIANRGMTYCSLLFTFCLMLVARYRCSFLFALYSLLFALLLIIARCLLVFARSSYFLLFLDWLYNFGVWVLALSVYFPKKESKDYKGLLFV